jgi:hypothetical protein
MTIHFMSGGQVFAASGANAFPFLRISPDARASGLAEAVAADSQGSGVLFFNPGGLPLLEGSEIEAQHLSYVSGISYDYAALTHGEGRYGWGINAGYLRIDGLTRTVYDPSNVDRFDETGGIPAHDLLFSGGCGLKLSSSWSLGAVAKFFQETLDAATVNGAAFDVGSLYRIDREWSLGLAVRNVGPSYRFAGAMAQLPMTGNAGVWDRRLPWLSLGGQISKTIDEPVNVSLGVEGTPVDHVILRTGYKVRSESNDLGVFSNVTVGAGLALGSARVDYALESLGDFGLINRFSLTWRWASSPGSTETPDTQRRLINLP